MLYFLTLSKVLYGKHMNAFENMLILFNGYVGFKNYIDQITLIIRPSINVPHKATVYN